MNKLSRKSWTAFCIIVAFEIFIFIIRFNFMDTPMIFFKSLFHLLGVSTAYLINDSYIRGFLLTLSILSILIILFLIRRSLKEPLETYGFHFQQFHQQLISGVLLTFIIVWFRGGQNIKEILYMSDHFIEYFSVQTILNLICSLIFAAQEEILFRGFLLTFFQKLFKHPMIGMFLSAAIFGLVHYPIGHNIDQVITPFILGLIYGYLRLKAPKTFTIFSLSLSHCLYNFTWTLL